MERLIGVRSISSINFTEFQCLTEELDLNE